MFAAQFVNLHIAARLVGIDVALLQKRAARGCYGPLWRDGAEVLVSTRGLELVSGRAIAPVHIRAAKAGEPLPDIDCAAPRFPKIRKLSREQIGAEVARAFHIDLESL